MDLFLPSLRGNKNYELKNITTITAIGKAKSCLHKVHLTICFGESEACGKTKTFVSQHVKFKIMMNKPLTNEFGYNRKKITGPGTIRFIQ